ncbi:MAG: hypothetical protein LBB36_05310 [Fibromonadaceae bacterium]|jgi:hypothetical protein|nr:hypothetical protein [Fibromonadaceae bacterium]
MSQTPKILKILLIMVQTMILTISCSSFKANTPNGFAAYEEELWSDDFRAISPDGVLYRVSENEQKSAASVEFWEEAIGLKMKNTGYKTVEKINVEIDKTQVNGFLFSAEQNQKEYYYMIIAIPTKNNVVLIEAAGEKSLFEKERENILKAASQVRVK